MKGTSFLIKIGISISILLILIVVNYCSKQYSPAYRNESTIVPAKDPTKFNGVVSSVSTGGGYTVLKIDGDEKEYRLISRNPNLGKLYNNLKSGDSISKMPYNDTITVIRNGKKIKFW